MMSTLKTALAAATTNNKRPRSDSDTKNACVKTLLRQRVLL